MDNLKIQGIFPSSISEISYANEQSEFGYSMAQHPMIHYKATDRLADYQIKINGPDPRQTQLPLQKWQKFEKNSLVTPMVPDQNIIPVSDWAEYKDKVTGYDLNKDSFSQEEILKAFNIIDITKDDVITEEDLTFVLDYIKEDYTQEEVKEMISMLSADKKHVTIDDFKKLGRGQILPLAKFKIPDQTIKDKSRMLQNISNTQLLNQDPLYLVECIKKQSISFSKFQQSKKGAKVQTKIVKSQNSGKDKLFDTVPLRSKVEYRQRKQAFNKNVLASLDQIVTNYLDFKDRIISIQGVANMLQVSMKEAKQLYPGVTEVDSLLVIMEAITYSRTNIRKKLQLNLQFANVKNQVSFNELCYVLQILNGKDDSLTNKMMAIMKGKKIKIDENIDKNNAYQIVLEFTNKLFL